MFQKPWISVTEMKTALTASASNKHILHLCYTYYSICHMHRSNTSQHTTQRLQTVFIFAFPSPKVPYEEYGRRDNKIDNRKALLSTPKGTTTKEVEKWRNTWCLLCVCSSPSDANKWKYSGAMERRMTQRRKIIHAEHTYLPASQTGRTYFCY